MKWGKMQNIKKVFSAFHRNKGIFFSVSGVFHFCRFSHRAVLIRLSAKASLFGFDDKGN